MYSDKNPRNNLRKIGEHLIELADEPADGLSIDHHAVNEPGGNDSERLVIETIRLTYRK